MGENPSFTMRANSDELSHDAHEANEGLSNKDKTSGDVVIVVFLFDKSRRKICFMQHVSGI